MCLLLIYGLTPGKRLDFEACLQSTNCAIHGKEAKVSMPEFVLVSAR